MRPISKPADSSVELHSLISERWSPRAFDPNTELSWDALRRLAEAARWAPSCGNTQPARYLFGLRGDDTYQRIFDVLLRGNKNWAVNAAALILGVAVHRNEKGDVPYAEYGVGLASQNLVLQAVADGLVAHQMAGFDADAAREKFAVPEYATPLVAIAVGGAGALDVLPEDRRDQERKPRTRLPLDEVAFAGDWGKAAF